MANSKTDGSIEKNAASIREIKTFVTEFKIDKNLRLIVNVKKGLI